MTPAQLKQMFELAYYYSLPTALRALFGLLDQPAGVKNVYFPPFQQPFARLIVVDGADRDEIIQTANPST